jgi:hypothetical protein
MEVRPASRGGGWILNMIVAGKSDTMVFTNEIVLTQTLMAMLNGAALAQMAARPQQPQGDFNPPPRDVSQRPENQVKQAVLAAPQQPKVEAPAAEPAKKRGRKLMTEAEKAAAKAAREAKKANSANIPAETAQAA